MLIRHRWDAREVELTRYAKVWLRPVPGTELLLLGGILRGLIDQGLEKTEWLEENCESPATLFYALRSLDLSQIAQETGVAEADITEAARLYGQAESAALVYALDNIPAEIQKDCVRALVALTLVTGNLGKPGSGLYPMRQGANEQGAWDMGSLPDRLPGYRNVADDAARQGLELAWGSPLPAAPGLDVASALQGAVDGRVKAMLVVGDSINFENGLLGDGLAALDALEFLVVQDTFLSAAAQRAEVVLPRSTFAEKEGTFTNLERRIQQFSPALKAGDDGPRPESWLISQLAQRMNAPGFQHGSSAEIMDEIATLVPIYAGVSHRRLEQEGGLILRTRVDSPQPTQVLYSSKEYRGIQWPCTGQDAKSTKTLYSSGFPAEKAEVETPQFRAAETPADPDYPAWLVPGRVLQQLGRELEVVKGKRNQIVREELVELNSDDAASWQIQDGDEVEVSTRNPISRNPISEESRLVGRARIEPSVPPGVISTTSLFGQLASEMEASEDMVPASRLPGLPIRPARIEKTGVGSAPPPVA